MSKPSKDFIEKFNDKWSMEGFAQSARDHVGRTIDSGAIVDLLLNAGLAYQSYQILNGKDNGPVTALYGPIALKLATTFGGTPPVSQIAGLAGLAVLGIYSVPGPGTLPGSGPIHDQAQSVENTLPFPLNYVFAYGYQAGNATGEELKKIQAEWADLQGSIGKAITDWYDKIAGG